MNKNISIRLFCEDTLGVGEKINLEKDQMHYLKNVMRCKINDKVIVFDKPPDFKTIFSLLDSTIEKLGLLEKPALPRSAKPEDI